MAFTIEQLNALDDAIAQGVLEVKYADKTVTYRSLAEMMRIRGLIERGIGRGSSSRKYAVHSKGLHNEEDSLV